MRLCAAAGLLIAAVLFVGCATEPEGGLQAVDDGQAATPERFGTVAQSLSNVCITASADNPSSFESASLSTEAENLIVTFKFERPYSLGAGAPRSVSIQRPDRLIVEVGQVRAYAFLSPDYEKKAVNYEIRDDAINGDQIPDASLDNEGDELVMTVPLLADIKPDVGTPVQWKVEAQGVDCPGDPDFDANWLWTDILM